jgi:Putative zinc-finger
MECVKVKERLALYVDNALPDDDRREMRQHMSDCNGCARESERFRRISDVVRSLPKRTPPPELVMQLRVVASKARALSATAASPWSRWRSRFKLDLSNLMRPVALPVLGGVCSALFLFSALAPTFSPMFGMSKLPSRFDVPTMLITEPMVKCTAPVAFGESDAAVDVTLDEHGRLVSYQFVSGPALKSEQIRRSIENRLLFTEFWPATAFGRPVAGTIRVFYGNSHIEVKG